MSELQISGIGNIKVQLLFFKPCLSDNMVERAGSISCSDI